MVESNNSNNQFYTQYHTPRPTRIQTPRNNIIAYSIANKRRRDNQAKRKKEWNDVVRRVRASLNPTPVRTQRIKSTPRRVNTTQTPVNYNKIVKEAINESNAVNALLNLKRKPDANKQKKVKLMSEANKEKTRKYKREWRASRTEAQKEATKQRGREYYHKRMASMTEANKQKKANSTTESKLEKRRKSRRESYHKSMASMTEAEKEAKRQRHKELAKKRRASMTEANKEAERQYVRYRRELAKKRRASITEAK